MIKVVGCLTASFMQTSYLQIDGKFLPILEDVYENYGRRRRWLLHPNVPRRLHPHISESIGDNLIDECYRGAISSVLP